MLLHPCISCQWVSYKYRTFYVSLLNHNRSDEQGIATCEGADLFGAHRRNDGMNTKIEKHASTKMKASKTLQLMGTMVTNINVSRAGTGIKEGGMTWEVRREKWRRLQWMYIGVSQYDQTEQSWASSDGSPTLH